MRTLPDFDELNNIRPAVAGEIYSSIEELRQPGEKRLNRKRYEDMIFDLLTMAYVYGLEVAGLDLGRDIPLNNNKMRDSIFGKVAGRTWTDRLNEHINAAETLLNDESNETPQIIQIADILINQLSTIAETEAHRVINEGVLDGAYEYQRTHPDEIVYKTWLTMEDEKVRDAHWLLQGSTVLLDAYFYVDDARALAPGGFGVPELDINCRCIIRLTAVPIR